MIPEQTIIGILTCPSDDTSRCSGKYCLGRVKDDLGFDIKGDLLARVAQIA